MYEEKPDITLLVQTDIRLAISSSLCSNRSTLDWSSAISASFVHSSVVPSEQSSVDGNISSNLASSSHSSSWITSSQRSYMWALQHSVWASEFTSALLLSHLFSTEIISSSKVANLKVPLEVGRLERQLHPRCRTGRCEWQAQYWGPSSRHIRSAWCHRAKFKSEMMNRRGWYDSIETSGGNSPRELTPCGSAPSWIKSARISPPSSMVRGQFRVPWAPMELAMKWWRTENWYESTALASAPSFKSSLYVSRVWPWACINSVRPLLSIWAMSKDGSSLIRNRNKDSIMVQLLELECSLGTWLKGIWYQSPESYSSHSHQYVMPMLQ